MTQLPVPRPAIEDTTVDDDSFSLIESQDVLAPGYYWRCKLPLKVKEENRFGYSFDIGDVHLLVDVFEFEGAAHSVKLLDHPGSSKNEVTILVAEFLAHFDPAHDGEEVRQAEQAAIMQGIADIQQEMASAQRDPLALPGIRKAAEGAIEELEHELVAEASAQQATTEKRLSDLRRIHRRAARRSTAAGNPLVIKRATISDQLGTVLSEGLSSDGLQDLTLEARRRTAVAEATASWLDGKAKEMTRTLERLAPYYAEKGAVAMARASKATTYVKRLTDGLNSLKLYTGDGVDVVTLREGTDAPSSEPLTLIAGKRFMDEELAVWADVDESFDWNDQPTFFKHLAENDRLLEQVLPMPRCVVTMAVTRRDVDYKDANPFTAMMNSIENKRVFLLVRNGNSVHAVYSSEPSHEAAKRLFPAQSELEGAFTGLDGSTIGLQDVGFSKASKKFDNIRLHYVRFLILLCGLDHRMRLFGEFYPPAESMRFMTGEFQARYFRFFEDEDPAQQIGDQLPDVKAWMYECNQSVRSGSRIIVTALAEQASPALQRSRSTELDAGKLDQCFIATQEQGSHYVMLPTRGRWREKDGQAKAWLNGPQAKGVTADWYLCVDKVRIHTIRRYIYSRANRVANIGWLRVFKRTEAILAGDLQEQQNLRHYLRSTALDAGVLMETTVEEAMEQAIATWRAARRGATAPRPEDIKSANEILTLMYPADRLAQDSQQALEAFLTAGQLQPLRLSRTGKTRLVLYVVASGSDRAKIPAGLKWSWVKRLVLEPLRTKLSQVSSSFVWLQQGVVDPTETVVRDWPALSSWTNATPEPCAIKELAAFGSDLAQAVADWKDILSPTSDGSGLPDSLFLSICQSSVSLLSRLGYVQTPYFLLPFGVHQDADGVPSFFYAKIPSMLLIETYGTPKQIQACGKLAGYWKAEHVGKVKNFWSIVATKRRLTSNVALDNGELRTPVWARIETHERGGLSRKSRRWQAPPGRVPKAGPLHQRTKATLSFDRAVDTVMGVSPIARRTYRKALLDEASYLDLQHRGWGDDTDELKARSAAGRALAKKKQAEANGAYVPPHQYIHLSSMVWNSGQGRSMANRYFSVPKGSASATRGATQTFPRKHLEAPTS